MIMLEVWRSNSYVEYDAAIKLMGERVEQIINKSALSTIWLLEHPSIYTLGASASASDVPLCPKYIFPVYYTERGGKCTYHGPGQRVIYLMLDLQSMYNKSMCGKNKDVSHNIHNISKAQSKAQCTSNPDIRMFVRDIERVLIDSLLHFGIVAFTMACAGFTGVWVDNGVGNGVGNDVSNDTNQTRMKNGDTNITAHQEVDFGTRVSKIAAIGLKLRRWVTYHGISLNIHTDISHYFGIVPCGLTNSCMTSMEKLGYNTKIPEFDTIFLDKFSTIFNVKLGEIITVNCGK